jgi:hypothetical protein
MIHLLFSPFNSRTSKRISSCMSLPSVCRNVISKDFPLPKPWYNLYMIHTRAVLDKTVTAGRLLSLYHSFYHYLACSFISPEQFMFQQQTDFLFLSKYKFKTLKFMWFIFYYKPRMWYFYRNLCCISRQLHIINVLSFMHLNTFYSKIKIIF